MLLATESHKGKLTGLLWNGTKYADACTISYSEIQDKDLEITHYYGLSDIRFQGIYDYTWNFVTRIVYIKIGLIRHIDQANQCFFNRKKLIAKKRTELLQFMMNDQFDRDHDGIDSIQLMTKLCSIECVLHPSVDDQSKKLHMYLDFFCGKW